MSELYHELILDLNRHPLNKNKPANFDDLKEGHNPLCGDKISLYLKWNKKGEVTEACWDGNSCAVSSASASLLTDHIKGMTKLQIKKIDKKTILKLLGIKEINPTRLRCALLPLSALHNDK